MAAQPLAAAALALRRRSDARPTPWQPGRSSTRRWPCLPPRRRRSTSCRRPPPRTPAITYPAGCTHPRDPVRQTSSSTRSARCDPEEELRAWWDVQLDGDRRVALAEAALALGHLGRSESVCSATLLDGDPPSRTRRLRAHICGRTAGSRLRACRASLRGKRRSVARARAVSRRSPRPPPARTAWRTVRGIRRSSNDGTSAGTVTDARPPHDRQIPPRRRSATRDTRSRSGRHTSESRAPGALWSTIQRCRFTRFQRPRWQHPTRRSASPRALPRDPGTRPSSRRAPHGLGAGRFRTARGGVPGRALEDSHARLARTAPSRAHRARRR